VNWPSFYRPEFLWGTLFLAAVLGIHLLMRPRRKTLDFSTLRFFREAAVRTSRMRQLRRLLLLLARLAAVAALIAMFARPFDKNNRLSLLRDPHLNVFTWIDPTPSMDYNDGSGSLLSRANALVDSLRRSLPSSTRHYGYDEAQGEFVPYDPAKPATERSRHGPAGLEKMFTVWNKARAACPLPLLVLFSDYQKTTTAGLDTLLRRMPPQSPVLCVTLTPDNPRNFSVSDVRFRDASSGAALSAEVKTQGKRLDSAALAIELSGIRTGQKRVSVPANDSAVITMADVAAAPGVTGGSVSLAAEDPLSFDNTAWFVSGKRSALRVIIVGDRERNFPVAAAFIAAGKEKWYPVTLKENDAVTYDDMDSADVVVVNAATRISRQLEAFVSGRSSSKKTVLFSLGADEESFTAGTAFISKIYRSSTPLKFTTVTTPATAMLPDTISELWHGFPGTRINETAIYRYAEGLPGTALLRLDNGAPLVTCIPENQERSWLIVATPIGITDANNLCETGFYVPLIDRIVRYAACVNPGAAEEWTAGFERRNPAFGTGKGAAVLNEEGKLVERWQAQQNVLFRQPGLYKIIPDGKPTYWIAVNPDTVESRLLYVLPALPEVKNDNVLILSEKKLINILNGHASFLSYLPIVLLLLALFAEVLLWEKPDGSAEGIKKKNEGDKT
jgi:hypothetical protein